MNRRAFLSRTGAGAAGAVGALTAGCIRYEQPRRRRGASSNTTPSPGGAGGADSGSVIFSSPMDSQSEIDRFPNTSHSSNISLARDPAGTGRDVVRVHVPEDEERGGTLAHAPNEVRDGSRTGENDPDAAYLRYSVYFPDDTQMYDPNESNHGTKLPGLAGFYSQNGNGGREGDGHSWSARVQTDVAQESTSNSAFEMNFYVYHLDQDRGYGDMLSWDGTYNFGQWHDVTLFVRMNTPGQRDGILRAWMNGSGDPVFERTDFRFRSEDHPNAGITRAYGAYLYWGGTWGSPASQNVYFKDFSYRHANSSAGGA